MRYEFGEQPNEIETGESYRSNSSVKESLEIQTIDRDGSITRSEHKTILTQEEERQDVNIGKIEARHKFGDGVEYKILFEEIERIDREFRSGSPESAEPISLTSTFNNDDEISSSMHTKLMRLIRAMIPNSTQEQKETFIRDLFDMGIRVGPKSSIRSQVQNDSRFVDYTKSVSVDELMIEESNSIMESINGKDFTESSEEKQDDVFSPLNFDPPIKKVQSLDDYIDGVNSIIESQDEYDAVAVNEEPAQIDHSPSIENQGTNSSNDVDNRWEELRNKILSESASKLSTDGTNSLTSEMEADLIQECVETGINSSRTTSTSKRPQLECQTTGENDESKHCESDGNTSPLSMIMNDMHRMKMNEHPSQADAIDLDILQRPTQADATSLDILQRPGRADETSIHKPEKRCDPSDSFEIDAMANSIIQKAKSESSNMSSFDEGPMDENEENSFDNSEFVQTRHEISSELPTVNQHQIVVEENVTSDESAYETTLQPSLKDRPTLGGSTFSTMKTPKADSRDYFNGGVGDSSIVTTDESSAGSCRHISNLIFVKSSITIGTVITTPTKEGDRSFFQSVDLSNCETWEKSVSSDHRDNLESEVQPSWKLSPTDSFSDFMLTILSAETGTTTNYFVHKHMMAIGPRCSKYMNEVFTSENTSTFQMTLDEKTSTLIPSILDYIYYLDDDITITTDNAVALRQLGKMLQITPLEVNAASFILEDVRIDNLMTYVADCCFFNDEEVTKVVVEKCTEKIESIPVIDRLWIVMEPELFLRVISSPHIDRDALSKHLSILLREYLELHQYEINVDLFVTLTSKSIIPVVDRDAALPLIELSDFYNSKECEVLQKRCAYTYACYWQTTPQSERLRLFALMRNLPSSITVDFLEIVESGNGALAESRSKMEQLSTCSGMGESIVHKSKKTSIEDFCGNLVEDDFSQSSMLTWRMDPEKSYSDWAIQVKYINHEGFQVYHIHKQILAVGTDQSTFFAEHFNSTGVTAGEKRCTSIELNYEAALVVPLVLDFVYSQEGKLEISHENSVALHYVARAFGISTLCKKVLEFISQNVALDNIADYIIDAGYYRDYTVIAIAGRLCAQDITSIDIESELLKELEPDFFEKVVSCHTVEQAAKPHVNVLITKYFSLHPLEGDVVEKLLKSIDVNRIDKLSALNLLKIMSCLKGYEGIETFETMKSNSVDVITENWTELTADNERREEIFSALPSLNSDLVTRMFVGVDSKNRMERHASASEEEKLMNDATEARRLHEEEVSGLKKELELYKTRMLSLQRALEGKPNPAPPKKEEACQDTDSVEMDASWYQYVDINEIGRSKIEGTDERAEGSERRDDAPEDEDGGNDQQSVCTDKVQKQKGRICCSA